MTNIQDLYPASSGGYSSGLNGRPLDVKMSGRFCLLGRPRDLKTSPYRNRKPMSISFPGDAERMVKSGRTMEKKQGGDVP